MSAYGYERGFVVEHDDSHRKSLRCSDCVNYNKSDRSCMKTPRYLPEDGYNSWKYCNFFELNRGIPYYSKKKTQYIEWSQKEARREIKEKKEKFAKKNTFMKHAHEEQINIQAKPAINHLQDKKELTDKDCRKFTLVECNSIKPSTKPRDIRYLSIYSDDGRKNVVEILVSGDKAYCAIKKYPDECIREVRRIFK